MKIGIIGYSQTKFGELWDKGIRDLIRDVGLKVMEDTKIKKEDIGKVICANALSNVVNGQSNINSICSEELGIKSSSTINCGDASGAAAIRQAILEIESGRTNIIMVLGIEKVTDLTAGQVTTATSQLLDQELEAFHGATLTSIYAMLTRSYMEKFKINEKQLSRIPVLRHKFALDNDNAQFKIEISEEAVEKSSIVASPVRLLHNSSVCDGAAAIILCNEKYAKKYSDNPAFIIASGFGNDNLALHSRENLLEFKSTKIAAEEAFKEAGIKRSEISIAEVHDTTTIGEIIAVEDLGFCEKGDGLKFILKDNVKINHSGGLKACGNPLGATGIRQAIDICKNLKEKKGYGLTQTISGSGSFTIVNIFKGD